MMGESLKGRRRKGTNIPYSLVFGETEGVSLSEHPFAQELAWLRQYCTEGVTLAGFYLLEGSELQPTRIWHGHLNDINEYFRCLWEAPAEPQEDDE